MHRCLKDISCKQHIKMNEIVKNFLLVGDKFMPEIHLKQPGFTYSACGPFTKNKKRIQKFKETRDTRYIYKNELDKACFQHDMTHGDFTDLKSLLGNLLTGKGINRAGKGKGAIAIRQVWGTNRAGEGVLKAGYGNKIDF